MSWLKIGSGHVSKMKANSNSAWETLTYTGSAVPLPKRWLDVDPPGSIIVDLKAPKPELVKVTPSAPQGVPKDASESPYLAGKFAVLRWTGSFYPDGDPAYWGFKKFEICRVEGGAVTRKLFVATGSPGAQSRELVHPAKDYPGSGNPIPEGVYSVAPLMSQNYNESGVGYEKIPLDQLKSAPNDRSDLLAHNDANRASAPGSMGCIIALSDGGWEALKAVLIGCSYLIVDYGQGYLKSIGVEIGPKPKAVSDSARPVVQSSIFESALSFTLKWEGGSVDNANDIGGRTNRGITQASYDSWRSSSHLPKQDVYLSTLDEAKAIYEQRYWEPLGTSSAALEVVNFDTGVMHGTDGAIMFVQEALGLTMTGTYDQTTRAAVMAADKDKLAAKIVQGRIAYRHDRVAQNASQSVFLEGWLTRDRALESYIKGL